jgi:hypothetical protein
MIAKSFENLVFCVFPTTKEEKDRDFVCWIQRATQTAT